MGKGSRQRAQRQQTPRSSVFPNFPYDRKFTRAEIDEILERSKRVGRAMRYGQGPNGAILALPPDIFELWMIHAALAGVDVNEEQAYIRPRISPDAIVGDSVEWVLKKEDTPQARELDLQREAAAHARQIEALDPKLRAAVVEMFTNKSQRVADRNAPSTVPESEALEVVEEQARAAEIAKHTEGRETTP